MRSSWGISVLTVLVFWTIACGPGSRTNTGDDDTQQPDAGDPPMCQGDSCANQCSDPLANLVYVLDDKNHIHSFDPRKLAAQKTGAFADLGELNCPHSRWPIDGSDNDVTPMSMSVDRDANAWVHYTSGEIFRVPLSNIGACAQTGYTPGQANMDLFGMGFVTDAVNGNTEHLFLAGGDITTTPGGELASVDPLGKPLKTVRLGKLTDQGEHSPELCGTGGAELWGFYPGIDTAWVQQIDRATGAPKGARKDIPGGLGGPGATPSVTAWAFAQYDGIFYIFATTKPGEQFPPNSSLRTIDQSGKYTLVLEYMPWTIVGAGVSTCSPFVIL